MQVVQASLHVLFPSGRVLSFSHSRSKSPQPPAVSMYSFILFTVVPFWILPYPGARVENLIKEFICVIGSWAPLLWILDEWIRKIGCLARHTCSPWSHWRQLCNLWPHVCRSSHFDHYYVEPGLDLVVLQNPLWPRSTWEILFWVVQPFKHSSGFNNLLSLNAANSWVPNNIWSAVQNCSVVPWNVSLLSCP